MAVVCAFSGCSGKSIQEDNPVFAAAPPRRSLVNTAAESPGPRFAATVKNGVIQRASHGSTVDDPIQGTTVVCEVNGAPVFVDDLLGSLRRSIDAEEQLTDEQRQMILREQLKRRLPQYVEQEIVLAALHQKIPADRQDAIKDSLEPEFQKVLASIRADRNMESEEALQTALAAEGMTIDLLREAFQRVQLVNGFLHTLAEAPSTIDRQELLNYYKDHRDDFTTGARVRTAEISVSFDEQGGREGAEKVMANVVVQLQQNADFSTVASTFSDSLSAEHGGDMGWIHPGTLADSDLENDLLEMPVGAMTQVVTRTNRFEVFQVTHREEKNTTPFGEVQTDIEQLLMREKAQLAKKKAFDEIKARSTVVSLIDGIEAFPEEANPVQTVSATAETPHSH
jgi:parvulin-like peptidyl-prolyl isomerase